jgi:hypothetical protein
MKVVIPGHQSRVHEMAKSDESGDWDRMWAMASAMIFHWDGSIKLSDIFVALGFTVTSVTALLAFRQFRMAAVTNRARFLLDIMRWHYDDQDLRSLFYRLDYHKWKFDAQSFPLSEDEPAIDHMLILYVIIGHFVRLGVLRKEEIPIIRFDASRVLRNPEIIKYLAWLDGQYKSVGVRTPAFECARDLASRIDA